MKDQTLTGAAGQQHRDIICAVEESGRSHSFTGKRTRSKMEPGEITSPHECLLHEHFVEVKINMSHVISDFLQMCL